jgi:hypothetical protein
LCGAKRDQVGKRISPSTAPPTARRHDAGAVEGPQPACGKAKQTSNLGSRKHIGDGLAHVGKTLRSFDRRPLAVAARPRFDASASRAEQNVYDLVGSATVFLSHLLSFRACGANDEDAARLP